MARARTVGQVDGGGAGPVPAGVYLCGRVHHRQSINLESLAAPPHTQSFIINAPLARLPSVLT